MYLGLSGKVAVVTGAGSGIGREAAIALANEGVITVLVGRNLSRIQETHRIIKDNGKESYAITSDISQPRAVRNLFAKVKKQIGPVRIAFNNAGIFGEFNLLHNDSANNFRQTVDVNLRGTWLCMQQEIRQMLEVGGGVIVNCSSVAGVIGHVQSCVYSATKHAIIGLSRSAALQYARDGIRINIVCPGSTDTLMLRSIYSDQVLARRAEELPIGRFATPGEIAKVVVWLCSSESSFITGQVIMADGGATAGRAHLPQKTPPYIAKPPKQNK